MVGWGGCNEERVFFSLLMYTGIITYGLGKKKLLPLFIFWTTFLLDLDLNFRQTVDIPIGTSCAPLVADLFLFCCERDSMKSLKGKLG